MTTIGPGDLFGKYRIEEIIGKGGFSRVYRAIQTGPGGFSKQVAIKVLRREALAREGTVESFFREARIIALLNHRNIVQVHEFAQESDMYFLVMEYIDGVTLGQLSRQLGDMLPSWLSVGIGLEVCRALRYAHGLQDQKANVNGVIHRDIKPSNILISQQGDVKVADFGLAKISRISESVSAVILGTPLFMSPEQRSGQPATTKSDIYALATILCHLCAGITPREVERGEAQAVLHRSTNVPEELRELLIKGIHQDPVQRPDALSFSEALQETLARIAAPGHLSGLSDELSRWVKRAKEYEQLDGQPGTGTITITQADRVDPFAPQIVVRQQINAADETVKDTTPLPFQKTRILDTQSVISRRGRSWVGLLTGAGILILVSLALLLVRLRPEAQVEHEAYSRGLAADAGCDATLEKKSDAKLKLDTATKRDTATRHDMATERDQFGAGARPVVVRYRRAKRRRSAKGKTRRKALSHLTGFGFFSVNADPWAMVYIDGQKYGETPLYRIQVPAGPHSVLFVSANGQKASLSL